MMQVRKEARHCSHCGSPDHAVKSCPEVNPEAAARREARERSYKAAAAKVHPFFARNYSSHCSPVQ